jgi:hypothetical protein
MISFHSCGERGYENAGVGTKLPDSVPIKGVKSWILSHSWGVKKRFGWEISISADVLVYSRNL